MKNYLKTLFLITLVTVSCSKDDGATVKTESYDTTVKITDAPIDNANVKTVFVTVTGVSVDGKSVEGFNKTTFDLAALVNGKTKTLGNLKLEAGSYSNIELALDYATDASGNAPGCYVETDDGEKDQLEASAKDISVTNIFEVFASNTNEIIIDFDLRKTVKEEQGTLSSNFEFVSMSELSAGIRAVNEETTGMISGMVNNSSDASDKIIVYAYKKGTFNAEVETQGQGKSKITFANAVASSEVGGLDNSYNLDFLVEGDYELVFVSYNKEDDGFRFNSLLEAKSTTGLDLGAINVKSAIQLSANVTVTGTKS